MATMGLRVISVVVMASVSARSPVARGSLRTTVVPPGGVICIGTECNPAASPARPRRRRSIPASPPATSARRPRASRSRHPLASRRARWPRCAPAGATRNVCSPLAGLIETVTRTGSATLPEATCCRAPAGSVSCTCRTTSPRLSAIEIPSVEMPRTASIDCNTSSGPVTLTMPGSTLTPVPLYPAAGWPVIAGFTTNVRVNSRCSRLTVTRAVSGFTLTRLIRRHASRSSDTVLAFTSARTPVRITSARDGIDERDQALGGRSPWPSLVPKMPRRGEALLRRADQRSFTGTSRCAGSPASRRCAAG